MKCGHPYNQDTSLVLKGVRIIGVPLYNERYTLDQQNYYFAKEKSAIQGKMMKRTRIFGHASNLLSSVEEWKDQTKAQNHTSKAALQSYYFGVQ